MSGGSFDYACYSAESDEYTEHIKKCKRIEEFCRKEEEHSAADEILIYIRNIETHQRRILAEGKRIADLLRAVEWYDSGDTTKEGIQKALNDMVNRLDE